MQVSYCCCVLHLRVVLALEASAAPSKHVTGYLVLALLTTPLSLCRGEQSLGSCVAVAASLLPQARWLMPLLSAISRRA